MPSRATTVAIVGRSGSGKTTLVKLPRRAARADRGERSIFDGFDLRTLDYRTLRRQIGFVLQESYLFDDTIAATSPSARRARPGRARAGRRSSRTRTTSSQRLPLGYETRIGEIGLRLSGGQQQRVAIARALYHRPPILLFDEATSALDTESERAVKQNLDELLEGRTSFVIAHRLSTIRDADRIVVLDAGPPRRAGHARRADGAAGALLLPREPAARALIPRRRLSARPYALATGNKWVLGALPRV